MTRIVLIDDHRLVRAGLRSLIECLPGYAVVAEGSDGDEALAILDEEKSDVLIIDISMSKVSGLEILPAIKERFPELPVIVLSMHACKDVVIAALKAGASAYLLKDAAEVELKLALQSVTAGHPYLSPRISGEVLTALVAPPADKEKEPSKAPLTQRQLQILRLIALGRGTKEIAYDLNLSNKTVESHRAQIMHRLGIKDVATLVRYAIRNGIISLDEGI